MEKLSVSEADAANELAPIAMDPYRRLLFALRDGTYPMVNEADFTQAFGEDEEAKGTASGSLRVTRRIVIFIFLLNLVYVRSADPPSMDYGRVLKNSYNAWSLSTTCCRHKGSSHAR